MNDIALLESDGMGGVEGNSVAILAVEIELCWVGHHTPVEVLQKISFAIEQMPEVIVNFDKYEYEVSPEKHFYTKHYKGEPSIRILCEIKTDEAKDVVLEICSVNFRKQQKDK